MSIYDVFGGSKPFDKENWAAQKQAQRKEAYELIDNTCSETVSVSTLMCRVALTVTRLPTPFWYRHRCPKRLS